MKPEYDSRIDNNTWTLVDEPEDQQVLPGKWVYKVKYGANVRPNRQAQSKIRSKGVCSNRRPRLS